MLSGGGFEVAYPARVQINAWHGAQTVKENAQRHGRYHGDSDRRLAGQLQFLLHVDEPEHN